MYMYMYVCELDSFKQLDYQKELIFAITKFGLIWANIPERGIPSTLLNPVFVCVHG